MRSADRPAGRGWAIAGVVLLLFAGLAVGATYTPLFAASDVRVDGFDGMARDDVLAIAGIVEGANVFHLDTRRAERRLERDPRILRAQVRTSLPDMIAIRIVPRVPVGILETAGALVGGDGVVIGPADATTVLPSLVAGGGGELGRVDLVNAAGTAAALGPHLRVVVDAVVVRPDGSLRLRLAAGFTATFGDGSELAAKIASLQALLDWAEAEDVAVRSADLTVPGSPTASLDRGGAPVPIP
jgi:cell division septal protein FtsQ